MNDILAAERAARLLRELGEHITDLREKNVREWRAAMTVEEREKCWAMDQAYARVERTLVRTVEKGEAAHTEERKRSGAEPQRSAN